MYSRKSGVVLALVLFGYGLVNAHAKEGLLGGFAAGLSLDVPAYAGLIDNTETLGTGFLFDMYTRPINGFVFNTGFIYETNIVNAGILLRAGAEYTIPLASWFSFDPSLSLGFGYRSEGYNPASGRLYGTLSLDVPVTIALGSRFALRFGARAIACLKGQDRYSTYTGEFVVTQTQAELAHSFPLYMMLRYSLR